MTRFQTLPSLEQMLTSTFFAKLGVFVAKDFLDAELCEKIRGELRSASGRPAMVSRNGRDLIDETGRKTTRLEVDAGTMLVVEERLQGLKPALESHFNLVLTERETPHFYLYKQGDFFGPHRDRSREPLHPQHARNRRVSVVVFLNGQAQEPGPDCYGGGALKLYALIEEPPLNACSFPVIGEPGMLVSFRSDVIHEVEAVSHGERYTIASWFS